MKYGYLLKQLVKKDLNAKYKGSLLGALWTVINPLLMLLVYSFAFSIVFQARYSGTGMKMQSSLVLFAGLMVYNFVSEIITRSTSIIASNVNFVKKVIFPLELMPVTIVISAGVNYLVSFLLVTGANLIMNRYISVTVWQVLPATAPVVFFSLGTAFIVSSLSVYIKDIGNFVNVLVTVLMFLSPVFYSLDSVPEGYRFICYLNPLTYMIENVRNCVLYNRSIDIKYLLISCLWAAAVCWAGYVIFRKSKAGFADVL